MLKVLGFTAGLSALLTMTSASSLAWPSKAHWVEFTPTQSGDSGSLLRSRNVSQRSADRVFVDVNSIHKKKGTNEVRYKVRHIYSQANSNGVVRSNSVYTAYCSINAQRLQEFTAYNISNRIVQSLKNTQTPLEQVTVESLNYSAFKYVCSR